MLLSTLLEQLSSFDPETEINVGYESTDWNWNPDLEMSEEIYSLDFTTDFTVEVKNNRIYLCRKADLDSAMF